MQILQEQKSVKRERVFLIMFKGSLALGLRLLANVMPGGGFAI